MAIGMIEAGRSAGFYPDVDEDDAALVARAKDDPRAFGLIYDRYAERIYRYCYRRLGTREAAEDATSVVFVNALAALPRYRERGSLTSWLFAIAHRTVIDAYRRQEPVASLSDVDERIDLDPSPEETALAKETSTTIWSHVSLLPADQRQVIELRLAGLTGAEIAEAMGRSRLSIKMLQFRAISALRRRLGAAEQGEAGRDRV
jgi:RNA polymerase sigma-70 factor (ECF subfamily)